MTAAGVLLLWLAIEVRAAALVDDALLIAWAVFLVLSSAALVRARRQGRRVVGQAGAAHEIRRWFTSQSDRRPL